MAELTVERVSKSIAGTEILRDVSFSVGDGSFFALLGPSGSGKTTILRTIAGFVAPDAGRVRVDGIDLAGVPPHKRNLGIVFQHYALFPHMSVFANVEFGLRMRRVTRAESQTAVDEALELVGIEHLAGRRPGQLSGGEQQRVALARALVVRPSLLLLDEPLSALDRKIRQELQVELKRVQRQTKITTVMVTHDQEEVIYLADELLVLDRGSIRQLGTPEDVYRRPHDAFVAGFMGASNLWQATLSQSGARPVAKIGSLEIPLASTRSDNGNRSVPTGSSVLISVRPENVVVEPATAAAPHPSTDAFARLAATIEEVELVGPLARVRLRVGELEITSLQLARMATRYAEGQRVAVTIDSDDISWYPEA